MYVYMYVYMYMYLARNVGEFAEIMCESQNKNRELYIMLYNATAHDCQIFIIRQK